MFMYLFIDFAENWIKGSVEYWGIRDQNEQQPDNCFKGGSRESVAFGFLKIFK